MVAGCRGDRLTGLAGDISGGRNDDGAGLFLSSPFVLEAAILPHASQELILSRFAEQAVVALVPGQAIGAAAAVQPVVAEVATQAIVRPEAVDDVVPAATGDHVPLAGAEEDIGSVRPNLGRGESLALRSARGARGGNALGRQDHQGGKQDGNETMGTQGNDGTRYGGFAPNRWSQWQGVLPESVKPPRVSGTNRHS